MYNPSGAMILQTAYPSYKKVFVHLHSTLVVIIFFSGQNYFYKIILVIENKFLLNKYPSKERDILLNRELVSSMNQTEVI